MDNLLLIYVLLNIVCCVIPAILLLAFGVFAMNRLNDWLAPDPARMREQFSRLQQKNPKMSRDQLVKKIIHEQSLKSGFIGAVTGLGGFVTLPIALPIDIYTSLQIQAAMVSFIAQAYGHSESSPIEERIKSTLIVSGTSRITESSIKLLLGFVGRVTGKALAKFIPFIGAAISFAVNYGMTQATGRVAESWYAANTKRLPKS